MDGNDKTGLESLAAQLDFDWWGWLAELGEDATVSAVMFLDWDTLPFGGVGE